jgi:uncharacterized RDD family membrane protein YckC
MEAAAAPAPWVRSKESAPPGVLVLSGWWRRAGAFVIDAVLVTGTGLLLRLVLPDTPRLGEYGIAAVLSLAYFVPIMVSTNGRTLGKMATGIRVIRTDQLPMNPSRVVLREYVLKSLVPTLLTDLLGLVSVILVPVGLLLVVLDYLWPIWDPERRAVHDMLARTRVVRVER